MAAAAIYKWLLRIGKVAGAVTFLFGIPYGTWEYLERKQDYRVEQSLKLFEKFNSAPFTEYRKNITRAVAANKQQLGDAAKDENKLTETVLAIVEKDIESDLWLVMDFFDGVAVCVVKNICDAATVDQLFRERALDFFLTFYQYIRAQRRSPASTFAIGLEIIATNGHTQVQR